jgi:signal transduction histidine kinase
MFLKLRSFLKDLPLESVRLEPSLIEGRVYGGHLMTLRHDQGDAYGSIIVLEDLTDETNLQERLRRAENLAAVGRMSAQVAHEVRNPLHSIGLEAEVAAEAAAKLGSPLIRQSLSSILASVDRLEKITENYLKLSRLSSGEKKVVDLGEVLESVLAIYTPACEAANVRVDWKREQRAQLGVFGDHDLLEQAIGNLLSNSLQALEGMKNPEIHFALGNTETGSAWLCIRDNGVGIQAEIREKLFTPFVTTRAQGTGLGLSFVKKVIEDHGGQVRVLDAELGAAFEIILPAADLTANVTVANTPGAQSYV